MATKYVNRDFTKLFLCLKSEVASQWRFSEVRHWFLLGNLHLSTVEYIPNYFCWTSALISGCSSVNFQIVIYHFISKAFNNICRNCSVFFFLVEKMRKPSPERRKIFAVVESREFLQFPLPKQPLCLSLLLILGLFFVSKNQQGQGRAHQWGWKVRNMML